MRRVLLWLIPAIAVAACGTTSGAWSAAGLHGRTYQDGGGWAVTVPHGWHAVPFRDSKGGVVASGVQLSNVRLPAPWVLPGFPIQANDRVMPYDGIALIIASDRDRRLSHIPNASLPLPSPNGPREKWAVGSSGAARGARESLPDIEVLWFRVGKAYFIASAKIGSTATGAAFKALAQAVRSIQSRPAGSG
jgi:hypothetical protein